MNAAEITLTFNNANHALPLDTPEVHITRRVYRSGEGEYLINRSPCRLRDIRDLLAGTGMGTQAYSVIEQGKVDVLLQSSPRDRRIIFEEAAGISRFKMRKLEALRRLERVDQNLLRLSRHHRRSGQPPAERAGAGRQGPPLQGVCRSPPGACAPRWGWSIGGGSAAGWRSWKRNSSRRPTSASAGGGGRIHRGPTAGNRRPHRTDQRVHSPVGSAHRRQPRADRRPGIDHRARALPPARTGAGDRPLPPAVAGLGARAEGLQQEFQQTTQAVADAEDRQRQIAQQVTDAERALTEVMGVWTACAARTSSGGRPNWSRCAGRRLGQPIRRLGEPGGRGRGGPPAQPPTASPSWTGNWSAWRPTWTSCAQQRHDLSRRADSQEGLLTGARLELARLQRELAAGQDELGGLQQRRSAAAERAAVLEELERRHEGLSAGVKEVLAQAGRPGSGPFQEVFGLVADLFCVSVEVAPLVDVALGQAAQHVVAAPSKELLRHVQEQSPRFGGRVGFLWLDAPATPATHAEVDLEGRPGVLGRADRFVETQPRFVPGAAVAGADLDRREAGARLRAGPHGRPGTRLRHSGGRIAGGRRHAGCRAAAAQRRPDLPPQPAPALRTQLADLEGKIAQGQAALAQLQQQIAQQDQQLQRARRSIAGRWTPWASSV